MVVDFAFVIAILKIILFDLVLSGDNAVVIGLAAHRLPPKQRKQAMIWGCGLAIVMRIGLTLIVSTLLFIPGLRFIGAVLLAWIACKLMQEEAQAAADPTVAPTSLLKAVQRIAMADFIMSLDNVLAIASAAQSWSQIVLGLVLSIMMLLFLSAIITEIMSRYRWIAYAGAALLAWTAADMMAHDLHEFFHAGYVAGWPEFPQWGVWALRIGLVTLCLTINWWLPGSARPAAYSHESEPEPAAETAAGPAPVESPVERVVES
ncbi:TerC family protein [Paludisphaera mucosa]|uniref:TerC family protein n=1 Tax=Paludisphaera mucosa TaxID=3030827 RepID=A0ABT6FCJ7_9BACT|nr:TerC family protein [Paludisphaera mucosa]MDG3005318.1 TerC family protein [Paludisphaera mucosa]